MCATTQMTSCNPAVKFKISKKWEFTFCILLVFCFGFGNIFKQKCPFFFNDYYFYPAFFVASNKWVNVWFSCFIVFLVGTTEPVWLLPGSVNPCCQAAEIFFLNSVVIVAPFWNTTVLQRFFFYSKTSVFMDTETRSLQNIDDMLWTCVSPSYRFPTNFNLKLCEPVSQAVTSQHLGT